MGYAWDRMNHICLLLRQHSSLFSQLQLLGSCKQIGHIIVPQPTHVLSALLQPQCLQPLKETQLFTITYIIFMVFGYKIYIQYTHAHTYCLIGVVSTNSNPGKA